MYTQAQYQESGAAITAALGDIPKIAVILGSGLGILADQAENSISLPYADIPRFCHSTAPGHTGRLIKGMLSGVPVVLLQGRLHYYEGHEAADTVYPIQVLRLLGLETLFVTNAAGGINEAYSPGDLMLITDHIKLSALSPLRGENQDFLGPRFPDMTKAYDPELLQTARECAKAAGIRLQEGVYAYMAGPQYETPAEIRMLRTLGADAVGMSTVAEVIAARHCGLRVLGLSCISNMAAGILDLPITAEEVLETGRRVQMEFGALLRMILQKITQF